MEHQKSILITGCSSGIGYACAHFMREKGWRVFASCRQQKDCDRRIAEGFESPLIDYADDASIRNGLAETIKATGGKLDALFNNGAFGTAGFAEDLSRGALREIFETNLFGVHELSRQVLPIFRAQGHGRIIQNSSVLGFAPARGRAAYTATKHALEGLTDIMRLELAREKTIKIVLIEPGPITSNIRVNAQRHFEKWIDWKNSYHAAYYESHILPRLYSTDGKKDRFELPETAVAEKLYRALTSENPKPRYYVTTLTYIAALIKRFLPHRIQDKLFVKT